MSTVTTESPSLRAELESFQKQFQAGTPKEIVELFAAKTAALAKTGVVQSAVQVGDQAPTFALPDAQGTTVRLQDLLAQGPVVLTFYRGGWCPYCNLQVRALQKMLPSIQSQGATLVAVSPELPAYISKTVQEAALEFPVLSDVGMTVGKQYGLGFVLDPELQAIYMKFGLDVPAHNGDATFQLPLPATYVIQPDGTVSYAFVNADYTQRAEPEDILQALAS